IIAPRQCYQFHTSSGREFTRRPCSALSALNFHERRAVLRLEADVGGYRVDQSDNKFREDFMKKLVASLSLAVAMAMLTQFAGAQTYPERTISMIVPFSAGGPTDTVARLVAEAMSRDLGQQVIVENVGGAGGTLGASRVAQAEADGYSLLLHHIGMATSATLYRNLAYNPLESFEYVGLVTEVPMTIIARPDFPAEDLQGLIAYVKENADDVTYANAGIGAASHLCGMLFMSEIGTELTTVPYQGTGPAMTDLLGGQVDFMCDQTTNTTSQ